MIKAIFFDIDGTLVSFQTHRASDRVLDALRRLREKGVKLFIATGRHPQMLAYIQSVFDFDGYITLSGQHCRCGETVVRSVPIEPALAEELELACRDNAFSCIFLEEREMYINYMDESTLGFLEELDLDAPRVGKLRRKGDLYQAIAFLTVEQEHLLHDRAPHVKTTRWHPNFLDVIPSSGGKDKGIDAVLEYLGIPLEETMAFGDGENDLSMLGHVQIGVAMGNANPKVQASADYVTDSVDEDGVVTALEHFGLLEP